MKPFQQGYLYLYKYVDFFYVSKMLYLSFYCSFEGSTVVFKNSLLLAPDNAFNIVLLIAV